MEAQEAAAGYLASSDFFTELERGYVYDWAHYSGLEISFTGFGGRQHKSKAELAFSLNSNSC